MPAAISTFVGRDTECVRLAELIGRHRIVTVVGPGGMGKTRLASEVCAQLDASFPGGVQRAELAPLSPRDAIEDEVAGTLGFPSLEALVLGLGDAPRLLVLDNCEHLLVAAARLCDRLLGASPALHVLATSREALGVDGEQVLVLGPLALPASADPRDLANASATRLFEDRAKSAGAHLEASPAELAARAELCRRLDGVPLAIELAAARSRSLTAVEILALLGRRFDLLQRATPVGRARHRSLRAAIDASYSLLEPEEQRFFRALGVFGGPFTADHAHAVAAPAAFDRLDSVDALSRLVDRSLVAAEAVRGTTRYRLLDSLRDYAAEQATIAGEWDALVDRFLDAMVADADRIVVAAQQRWSAELLATILDHFETMAGAIERAVATDADARRAFRLLLPLWGATHQGRAAEVAAAGERVLARWPEGREPFRAEATTVAASALLAAGRVERASTLAKLVSDDAAASPLACVIALRTLGIGARHRGDDAAAVAHYERASRLAADAGLPAFERELAVLAASTPREGAALEAALAALASAATRAAEQGDAITMVWSGIVQTQHLLRAGRFDEARAALAIAREAQVGFEYPYGIKVTLRMHATLTAIERGFAASRPAWVEAIDRCAHSGDLAELALTLGAGAALARRSGDAALADALLAAVPPGVHPTVLGEVFAEEGDAIARREGAASRPATGASAALWRARDLLAAAVPPAPTAEPSRAGALLPSGDGWTVRFGARSFPVRRMKGIDDLAVLLARPEQEVHCLELIGGADVGGEAGPSLDARAKREYQTRIRDLQTEIDRARDDNDTGRAERAEAELDALVQQLSEAFGLGGRTRAAGSATERARSAVTWRVRAAIKKLAELDAELGRHLENAVRTGTWCSYRPESPVAWEIQPRSS